MPFQTVVNFAPAVGVPGELLYFGPEPRVQPRILYSDGQAQTMGFAFTESTAGDIQLANTAIVGGTGFFAGILCQPKAHSTFGGSTGPLSPTLNVPDYTTGELLSFGDVLVSLPAAANIGDVIYFDKTTGALASTAVIASFTAAIAVTTGVMTVSAITAGNIGVGTMVYSAAGAMVGTITALGTGTGGTGTYQMNTVAAVSSTTMTTESSAPTGKTLVPKARVNHFPITAAGVACITLTN